jgi:hypothetical protein
VIYHLWQPGLFNCVVAGIFFVATGSTTSAPHIVVRAENFTVPPATGPLTHILARNTGDTECTVTIEPKYPDGWQWTPKHRTVTIEPGQLKRLPFTIEKAANNESNRYPVELTVIDVSGETVHRQDVVCASAPFFKPKIDGSFKDWSDAIPVTFTTDDSKTVVSTYWNKRYFYIYVQVQEKKLYSYKKKAPQIDAVQFALAPKNTVTPSELTAKAKRYEFLIIDVPGFFARDKCFCLMKPGVELSVTQQRRSLEMLQLKEALTIVKRQGTITHYECAIPFAVMPAIKPDVGREISLSVLVHDPDGTGIRDLGKAMGLWPEQRNWFAWCAWDSVKWSPDPPYDSKIEWGLCSSKH